MQFAWWAHRSYAPLSVCLSVCLFVVRAKLCNTSMIQDYVTWITDKGHMGQGHIIVPNKGRQAHKNAKSQVHEMLYFSYHA